MSLESIKSKIAKLLRLQGSSNVNEAANAAAMVRKLCKQYNLSTNDIPESEENVISCVEMIRTKRVNEAKRQLLSGVAQYFDCMVIVIDGSVKRESVRNLYGSKGNLIQCELYYEYLLEVMQDMADGAVLIAIANGEFITRSFRSIFMKNFADAIYDRLVEMKESEKAQINHPDSDGYALAVRSQNELDRVENYVTSLYGKLKTIKRRVNYGYGTAAAAGRRAAQNVSLNRQVSSKKVLCLPS